MWWDNCLLLLPLRGGAIVWAGIIVVYSSAGAYFLFKYGPFLFFAYPEWDVYAGISVTVAILAFINAVALSNCSDIWTVVCKFCWPFAVITSALRAIIMIIELDRYQLNIVWECENGGQLWGSSTSTSTSTSTLPGTMCTPGWQSLFTIFIIALLVDLVFQIYMMFLNWRFYKRLQHYDALKNTTYSGYYDV